MQHTEAFETTRSAAMYKRASRTLATGVSSSMRRHVTPVPLYMDRADGPYFYDVDGHELIDYTLGWGPLIVGSNHAGINRAVARQLERGYTFGCQHALEFELSELVVDSVPEVEQVIFANTGTEAIQAAIRIARASTGRDKILKFEGHYHGWMNNVLVSYHPSGGDAYTPQPSCGGQPASEYAETLVLPWNDLDALHELLAARGEEIACVLTEPVLANSGGCLPEPGYLAELIERCRQQGIISIFDEVITGFRLALGGAREFFDLVPDLSVYGKAIAGGFTMSAVAGKAAMFDVLRDGRTIHAGTYNGSTFNLIAAVETIKALRRPGVYEGMFAHGRALRETIEQAAARHRLALITSGVDTVFSVHFGLERPPRNFRETLASDKSLYGKFRAALLNEGIHLLPDGRWYVGAMHGPEQLERTLAAIDRAMDSIAP